MSRYIGPNPHRTSYPYAEKNPYIVPPKDPYHTGMTRDWDIEYDRKITAEHNTGSNYYRHAWIRENTGISQYGGEKHVLYRNDQQQDRRNLHQAPPSESFDLKFDSIDLSISIEADPRMNIDKAYSLPLWYSQDFFDHRQNQWYNGDYNSLT